MTIRYRAELELLPEAKRDLSSTWAAMRQFIPLDVESWKDAILDDLNDLKRDALSHHVLDGASAVGRQVRCKRIGTPGITQCVVYYEVKGKRVVVLRVRLVIQASLDLRRLPRISKEREVS